VPSSKPRNEILIAHAEKKEEQQPGTSARAPERHLHGPGPRNSTAARCRPNAEVERCSTPRTATSCSGRTVRGNRGRFQRLGYIEGQLATSPLKIPQREHGPHPRGLLPTKNLHKTDAEGKRKFLDCGPAADQRERPQVLRPASTRTRSPAEARAEQGRPTTRNEQVRHRLCENSTSTTSPDDRKIPRNPFVTGQEVHRQDPLRRPFRWAYSMFHGVWEWFYEHVVFFLLSEPSSPVVRSSSRGPDGMKRPSVDDLMTLASMPPRCRFRPIRHCQLCRSAPYRIPVGKCDPPFFARSCPCVGTFPSQRRSRRGPSSAAAAISAKPGSVSTITEPVNNGQGSMSGPPPLARPGQTRNARRPGDRRTDDRHPELRTVRMDKKQTGRRGSGRQAGDHRRQCSRKGPRWNRTIKTIAYGSNEQGPPASFQAPPASATASYRGMDVCLLDDLEP